MAQCLVKTCENTIRTAPHKYFFPIPVKPFTEREKWFNSVGIDLQTWTEHRNRGGMPLVAYCCQDHFKFPEDVRSMTDLRRTNGGIVSASLLKPGIYPRIVIPENADSHFVLIVGNKRPTTAAAATGEAVDEIPFIDCPAEGSNEKDPLSEAVSSISSVDESSSSSGSVTILDSDDSQVPPNKVETQVKFLPKLRIRNPLEINNPNMPTIVVDDDSSSSSLPSATPCPSQSSRPLPPCKPSPPQKAVESPIIKSSTAVQTSMADFLNKSSVTDIKSKSKVVDITSLYKVITSNHTKRCIDPTCTNTSLNRPESYFVQLPSTRTARELWLDSLDIPRSVLSEQNQRPLYCCKEHFNEPQKAVQQQEKSSEPQLVIMIPVTASGHTVTTVGLPPVSTVTTVTASASAEPDSSCNLKITEKPDVNRAERPVCPTKVIPKKENKIVQKKKDTGLEGKKFNPKAMPNPPVCGHDTNEYQCDQLALTDVTGFFTDYYDLPNIADQDKFIFSHMDRVDVPVEETLLFFMKTQTSDDNRRIPVCFDTFCRALAISPTLIIQKATRHFDKREAERRSFAPPASPDPVPPPDDAINETVPDDDETPELEEKPVVTSESISKKATTKPRKHVSEPSPVDDELARPLTGSKQTTPATAQIEKMPSQGPAEPPPVLPVEPSREVAVRAINEPENKKTGQTIEIKSENYWSYHLCHRCLKVTRCGEEYKAHRSRVCKRYTRIKYPVTCSTCSQYSAHSIPELKYHMETTHKYVCKFCSVSYSVFDGIKTHLRESKCKKKVTPSSTPKEFSPATTLKACSIVISKSPKIDHLAKKMSDTPKESPPRLSQHELDKKKESEKKDLYDAHLEKRRKEKPSSTRKRKNSGDSDERITRSGQELFKRDEKKGERSNSKMKCSERDVRIISDASEDIENSDARSNEVPKTSESEDSDDEIRPLRTFKKKSNWEERKTATSDRVAEKTTKNTGGIVVETRKARPCVTRRVSAQQRIRRTRRNRRRVLSSDESDNNFTPTDRTPGIRTGLQSSTESSSDSDGNKSRTSFSSGSNRNLAHPSKRPSIDQVYLCQVCAAPFSGLAGLKTHHRQFPDCLPEDSDFIPKTVSKEEAEKLRIKLIKKAEEEISSPENVKKRRISTISSSSVSDDEVEDTCKTCRGHFPLKSLLLKHYKNNEDCNPEMKETYSCPICPRKSKGYLTFWLHIAEHGRAPFIKKIERKFKCFVCRLIFLKVEHMIRHAYTSHKNQFFCSMCLYQGSKFTAFFRHVRMKHGKGKR